MTDTIRAPWTPEQVAALNQFQQRGGMHRFTCGGEHTPGSPSLVAHPDGWHCPEPYAEPCDYRQDWAHAFMADPAAWPKTFRERHDAARTTPDNPVASSVALANDSICDSYVPPTEPAESGCCARCGMYDWKHTSEVDQLRAEVQRDRDQHAAVLREVLSRFRPVRDNMTGKIIGYDGPTIDPDEHGRWRAVVAPTVERPWWEQVREAEATLARVRAALDGAAQ